LAFEITTLLTLLPENGVQHTMESLRNFTGIKQ